MLRSELRLPADRRRRVFSMFSSRIVAGQTMKITWSLGDDEVVHHGRHRHLDLLAAHEPARGVHHVVAEERRHEAVAEEEHLAGLGVELRMRGHRPGEAPGEVVRPLGLERARIERVRRPTLPEREQAPRVPDDVRVRGVRRGRVRERGADRSRPCRRARRRAPRPPRARSGSAPCAPSGCGTTTRPSRKRNAWIIPSPSNQW